VLGCLGLALSLLWLRQLHGPRQHPRIEAAELDYLQRGGALIDLEGPRGDAGGSQWRHLGLLLRQRTMIGIYFGQYCNNAITYFFLTWFPVYLVQARGMSILGAGFAAALPAISGCVGGVLGGLLSDGMLRRGHSLTLARKLPMVFGLLLSSSLVLCIFVEGGGSLGWTLVADTSPRQILGLSGGLFNTFGNLAAITTPIVIGYLVSHTGSFDWALAYVGLNALLAVVSFGLIVGQIHRIE